MFCSTIIPTIGRVSLSRAINSVLEQKCISADFEVIIVNDSGSPLPESKLPQSKKMQIINTNRRERSVARNTGASIAKGNYLNFLDDDDWLLPGALESLWKLSRQFQEAAILYGSSRLMNRRGQMLLELRHNLRGNCFIQLLAGEWIPLQASIISAEAFSRVGGFNAHISGPEDIDLCRRIALCGGIEGCQNVVVAIEMGEEGSSTNYSLHPAQSRLARETILNQEGVFARMISSANSSYWMGRVLRVYLTSVFWNLAHKKVFSALSRTIPAIASFFLSWRYVLSFNFWQAILHSYKSPTFAQGLQRIKSEKEKGAIKCN